MRRRGFFAVFALVVGVMLTAAIVVPAPASASMFKPKVDPYPDLPSAQYTSYVHTSKGYAGLINAPVGSTLWYEQQEAARQLLRDKGYMPPSDPARAKLTAVKSGKVPNISSLPKTITQPLPLVKGGVTAASGFGIGWGIGDGVLAAYTALNGPESNPLKAACGDDFWEGITGALYAFASPNCDFKFDDPNADQLDQYTGSGGGLTIIGYYLTCTGSGCTPGVPPTSGYGLRARTTNGENMEVYGKDSNGNWRALTIFTPEGRSGFGGPTFTSPGFRLCIRPHNLRANIECENGSKTVITPTVTKPDPVRKLACEADFPGLGKLTAPAGYEYKESSSLSMNSLGQVCVDAYKTWLQPVSKGGAGLAPGSIPSKITIKSTDDLGVTTNLQEQTLPEFTPEQQDAIRDTTGRGLVLWKGEDNCLNWEADCAGWFAQFRNGTATDYRCTFGGKPVQLGECVVYSKTFEPEYAPAPGADPGTSNPVITDPFTGEDRTWTKDGSQNSTDPSTGPTPGQSCMDTWSAAPNPIEWVVHPIKCALVWAFVPRESEIKNMQTRVERSWRGSMPGKLHAALITIPPSLTGIGEGNCGGAILSYPSPNADGSFTIKHAAVLPACPGDFFAPWAPVFKFFISASLAVGGFFGIKRVLDGFVGLR